MKYSFASITLFSLAVIFINMNSAYSQELVGEDERISVIVESMERANSFTDSPKTNDYSARRRVFIIFHAFGCFACEADILLSI